MKLSQKIVSEIQVQINDCIIEAIKQGFDDYDVTHDDLVSVAFAVKEECGRYPTEDEWEDAGFRMPSKYCA